MAKPGNSLPTLDPSDFLATPLNPDGSTEGQFPSGSQLSLEHDVAVLVLYRRQPADAGLPRLIRACLSYFIFDGDCPHAADILAHIARNMLRNVGAILFLEVRSGGSDGFVISGPQKRLDPEFKILANRLARIPARKDKQITATPQPWTFKYQEKPTFSHPQLALLQTLGATQVTLEIPPTFRSSEGKVYPIYLRKYRDRLTPAIQRFAFEFLRLQTSSELATYHSLGKRTLDDNSLRIDSGLTAIANAYQFLLLVAPINEAEIREGFFASGDQKAPPYRYRLLPVDPDLLKRQLFALRIEKIDDPSLAFIFAEKREELDQELTMLGERGSKNFFYSSIRRYRGIDSATLQEAENILKTIAPADPTTPSEPMVGAMAFAEIARQEFRDYQVQDPAFASAVHVRDDVNVLMVSQGQLYIPARQQLNQKEVIALTHHEIGTHVLTYYNGSRQPLQLLAAGLADYDPLQEGLAVMAEYLSGALSGSRLRTLAGRVVAGQALIEGAAFPETFHLLHKTWDFPREEAFSITVRMFQGGGFLKDTIYLDGLLKLREHLMKGGDFLPLLAGKFGLKHIPLVAELTGRGIMGRPALRPGYSFATTYGARLNRVREGLPLTEYHTT